MNITYHGVSSFYLTDESGLRIYIDPYMEESPVDFDDLPPADYILISHGAGDHVGRAFDLAKKYGCKLIGPPDVVEYAKINGVPAEQCYDVCSGAVREFPDLYVKTVWASHVSFIRLGGDRFITGVPVGYVITLPSGKKLYHMGDTSIFSDMKLIGELYKPDVLCVPIGMFRNGVTEMDPYEASFAVKWVNPKVAIPVHYDTLTQSHYPDLLKKHLAEQGVEIPVLDMRIGDTVDLDPYSV